MKKQIVEILRNIRIKGIKPAGKADVNRHASRVLSATGSIRSGGVLQDGPAVQMVDRKNFEKMVNDSLREKQGCVLVCDVDRCRDINNIYGRETGDAVLHSTECVLCDVFRGYARIGSRGSDIFALWIPEMSEYDADAIRKMTGMVNDKLLHPVGELPPASLSIGISFYEMGDDCRSLVKKAYKPLYIVKESGRCGCEMSL